ncbi:MAG: hypothetical protein WD009_00730 [Phycisphaeraceae bacterium]
MTETRRTLVRLAANYGRLAVTLVLGLAATRLVIAELGIDGFGLISLLGASVGLAAIGREIVARSLVRELGAAYHSGDDGQFVGVFNCALVVCLAVAGLCALAFAGVGAVMPWLNIPDELIAAGRWFVVAKGAQLVVNVSLAPLLNMYLISERMVAYNAYRTVDRVSMLLAILTVIALPMSVSTGVIVFGAVTAGIEILVAIGFAAAMALHDRRLRPRAGAVSRAGIGSVLSIGKWNVVTVAAMSLHVRTDAVVMNLFFGTVGNMLFGLALQLTSYSRMIAMGMTQGLDAVSARFSAGQARRSLDQLVYHSTRLHGLVVFPALGATLVLAEPLLRVWVGPRLEDPDVHLPNAAMLVMALTVGIGVRAISDGWVRILYGAGFIRRYAWWILVGGVVNPALAVVLILLLPGEWGLAGPAVAFSASMVVFHGLIIPAIGARCLEMSLWRLYRPLVRPLVATALAMPVLVAGQWTIEAWSLLVLAGVGLAFGLLYTGLVAGIVLRAEDWRRVTGALRRRPVAGRVPEG